MANHITCVGKEFAQKLLTEKDLLPFCWDLDKRKERLDHVWQKANWWIEDEPDLAVLYNLRGFVAYVRDNNLDKAKEDFNKALTIDSNNLISLASLIYINEQSECKKADIVEQLGKLSHNDIQREKNHAKYEQGFFYGRFGGTHYQDAELFLKQAIQFKKKTMYLRALVLVMSRRIKRTTLPGHSIPYKKAPAYFDQLSDYLLDLIENDGNNGLHYSILGEVLGYSHSYKNCEDWRNQFYDLHPDKTAEKCFNMAIELAPGDRYVRERLGHYYQHSDKKEEAISIYRRVIAKNPSKSSFAHAHLGKLSLSIKKFEIEPNPQSVNEAIHHFRRAIELNQMNHDSRIWLGRCHCIIKEYDEGLQHLKRAIELTTHEHDDKDATNARYYYCIALLDMGDWKKGYQEMETILSQQDQLNVPIAKWFDNHFDNMISRDPDDPQPYLHKAQSRMIINNYEAAASLYSKALQLFPTNDALRNGLESAKSNLTEA